MKTLAVLFALLLSSFVAAQPTSDSIIKTEAVGLEVVQNICRTAYFSVHGTYDGFNAGSVRLYSDNDATDLSRWIFKSAPFSRRLGTLRLFEEKGRVYHLWPALLRDKRQCRAILLAHYGG